MIDGRRCVIDGWCCAIDGWRCTIDGWRPLDGSVRIPGRGLAKSQSGQQLGLLCGELFVGDDAFVHEFAQLFDRGEDVSSGVGWRGGEWIKVARKRCWRWGDELSVAGDCGQVGEVYGAVLAAEDDGTPSALLLGETADLVVQGIVDPDFAAGFDGQPTAVCEVGVADIILRTRGGRGAEILRPPVGLGIGHEQARCAHGRPSGLVLGVEPALALRLETAGAQQAGLTGEEVADVPAQGVHSAFEEIVEHVADHDHAALHPLAGATEFPMTELGHAAVAIEDGEKHVSDGIDAKAVLVCQIVDDLLTLGRELLHSDRGRGRKGYCGDQPRVGGE